MRHAEQVVVVTDYSRDKVMLRRTAVCRMVSMSAYHRHKQATLKGNPENFCAAPAAGKILRQ